MRVNLNDCKILIAIILPFTVGPYFLIRQDGMKWCICPATDRPTAPMSSDRHLHMTSAIDNTTVSVSGRADALCQSILSNEKTWTLHGGQKRCLVDIIIA